jgi:hypothetical protein
LVGLDEMLSWQLERLIQVQLKHGLSPGLPA